MRWLLLYSVIWLYESGTNFVITVEKIAMSQGKKGSSLQIRHFQGKDK